MKRSKRYKAVAEKTQTEEPRSLVDAIALVKESPVQFDAGVELHFHLGIDPKKSDQMVRGTVVLPHGTGKSKRVAAFVSGDDVKTATDAGADLIGTDEVIEAIKKTGKCDFDIAVATPDMMKKLGPIAKTLGQQGLMPSPKTETVGTDVEGMVKELKAGKIAFRSDDGGNVHLLVGRVSFEAAQLEANVKTVVEVLRKMKPSDSKGIFLQTMTLSSSMGPGVKVVIE